MADLGVALPGAAATLSVEDSAGLVNDLKNKLQTLEGQHTDVLETLTPNVTKRVEALRDSVLLEKSMGVQCAEGERSYHIFYQLCAGATPVLKEKLNLKHANDYNNLRQSNCYTIAGVDDAERFRMVTVLRHMLSQQVYDTS